MIISSMEKKPSYDLILIFTDRAEISNQTKQSLISLFKILKIEESLIHIHENSIPFSDFERFCIGIYFGSDNAAKCKKNNTILQKLIKNNVLIIPVLFQKDNIEFSIPESLKPINVFRWRNQQSSTKLSHIILQELGLTEKDRKIFLSYRRTDGQAMANQLFDQLQRNRFQVFLDEFSLEVGENFQERLWNTLGDFAFLLLLESPDAEESKWIFEEILFALQNDIGILVLTWPETDVHVSNTRDLNRIVLLNQDIEITSRGSRLTSDTIQKVLSEIITAHAASLLNRRILMVNTLEEQLKTEYLMKKLTSWCLHAEPLNKSLRSESRIFSITPRKPNIINYFSIDMLPILDLRVDPNNRYLIHIDTALSKNDEDLLKWVDGKTNIRTRYLKDLLYGNEYQ